MGRRHCRCCRKRRRSSSSPSPVRRPKHQRSNPVFSMPPYPIAYGAAYSRHPLPYTRSYPPAAANPYARPLSQEYGWLQQPVPGQQPVQPPWPEEMLQAAQQAAFQLPPGGAFPGGSFGLQAGFPPHGAGFPPQGAGFPSQGAGFPPQGAGNGFPPQGAGFPPQGAGFPPQQAGFPPQGAPGNGFAGGPFPPEFLTNQGLPLTNPQGPPFQGFNVPAGFGGPSVPGNQNPYQQFGPGFGGPAPPGYSDEEHSEKQEKPQKDHPHPLADDPKSAADTVYASNGGYVYKRAK